MREVGVRVVLTGFSEAGGCRTFAFEGIAADWSRALHSVGVDLRLAQRCGIRLQELPLLCRRVVERALIKPETAGPEVLLLTETDMMAHLVEKTPAAGAKGRRSPRPSVGKPSGWAWRSNPV